MTENKLAKRDAQITVRDEIGQEIALRDKGDEGYRFQLRKLSNIHLGVRMTTAKGVEYPKATEYFVLGDGLREDTRFREKLESMGQDPDRPTKLPIMLLSNEFAATIVTSCDLYGQSGKLKCRSYDGQNCVQLNEKTCQYEEGKCPEVPCKDCAWYHRFRFMLPDAAGIGYHQIVTKSDNNHGALLREIRDLKRWRHGAVAGVDLMLALTNEREFHVPVTDKSGTTKMITTAPYLLHIEPYTNIRDLMQAEQIGEVYDADMVEEDLDEDVEPVVEGEPEAEVVEEAEEVEQMADDGQRSEIKRLAFHIGLKNKELHDIIVGAAPYAEKVVQLKMTDAYNIIAILQQMLDDRTEPDVEDLFKED